MTDRDDAPFEALTGRPAVLRRLCEGTAYKRDLVEEMDHSRSTLDRAVRELEAAGFVERTGEGVTATLAGRLAVDRLDTFQDDLGDIDTAGAVLEPLSSDAPVDPAAVTGAEARLADDPAPFRALQRVHDELAAAERYRGLLPALDDARHVRLLYDHVVTGGHPAQLVVTPDLFRTLREEFPRQLSAMAGQEGFELAVAESLPPFAVGLVGPSTDRGRGAGASSTTVTVVVFGDDGPVHGTLVNDAEGAVGWAERLFADASDGASDCTADLQTEAAGDGAGPDTDGGVSRVLSPGEEYLRGRTLPVGLERAGFVRFDDEFVRDEPVADPTTAWRAGLSLPEVHRGYAVPRYDDDGEPVADRIGAALEAGEDRVLVGPPGAGKSTTCKRVACDWYEEDRGPVLYREGGHSRPFEDVDALATTVDAVDGHALVVVEDAVRPDAASVFDAVERLGGRDDVSFLLDARGSEWADPADGVDPVDGVGVVPLPKLDRAALERVVDHFERTVPETVDVPVDRLRDDLVGTAPSEDGPGRMLLLLHRLATYADPLAEEETSLEAAVAALYDDFADDDVTLDVAVLVNTLNAAGLAVDAGALSTVAVGASTGSADRSGAVDAALDRLEGRVLFGRNGRNYRTVHEAWSVAFLDHLLERDGEAAAERFGRVVSALLARADDPGHRDVTPDHAGRWTPQRDPGAWADEAVEALYRLGHERPKLAPLFGDGRAAGDTVTLPDACADAVAARRPVWLGRALLAAGEYDHAERAFRRLPLDGGDGSGVDAEDPVVERLLGLSRVAEGRGDHVAAAAHARACLDRVDATKVAGGRAEKALGQSRFARGDLEAAATHYRAALEAFEAAGDRRRRADALNDLGAVAYRLGDYDRARACFQEDRQIRSDLGDRRGEASSLGNLGLVARQQGDLEAAHEYHERSLEVCREFGDRQGEAGCFGNLGVVAHLQGDYDRAQEYHERSLEQERELGNTRGVATSLVSLGIVASARGAFDRARQRFRESLEINQDLDNPSGIAKSHTELGIVAYRQGDFVRATEHLEEGLTIRRELGLRREAAINLANLGQVACRRGAFERAREHLEESLAIRRELEDRRGVASSRSSLGEVARRRGDRHAAREHLEAGLQTAQAVDDEEVAARCRLHLGELARERGAHDEARGHVEAALDAAEASGNRFEATEARLALGRLALAGGDHGRAAEVARDASERFAGMGATYGRGRAGLLAGRAAAAREDGTAAREHLEAALAAFTDGDAAGDALATLRQLVDVCEAAGDTGAAEQYRERAADLVAGAPAAAVGAYGNWLDEPNGTD